MYEINDHNDKIISLFFNRRLNMFATSSYDGYICIYILPNKLISMIKNERNSYYNQVFLSANPFPSIISFDKNVNKLTSYSINGLFIKSIILDPNIIDYNITPLFNVYGGNFRDRIIVSSKGYCQIFNVPFLTINKSENMFD